MQITVLTSSQNFVWHSMQEIIPYIEKTWEGLNSNDIQTKIYNVDDTSLNEILPVVLKSQLIVLTCFNLKVIKLASFIRNELQLPVNFVIHVHNMSTLAFWPFLQWGGVHFFKANDLFITSCLNDERTLLACFPQAKTLILPFSILEKPQAKLNINQLPCQLVYIGRISPQKNLHNLILAYSILKNRNIQLPQLNFFGKEDHLGSPNMALSMNSYQKFLENLIEELKLSDAIVFRGHVSRVEINTFLQENICLTLSPSLHSDENFGMAVFQSLLLQNPCLISDWGGHSDFLTNFKEQVTLMPIETSDFGPSLSAETIALYLEEICRKGLRKSKTQETPLYYQPQEHINKTKNSLLLDFTKKNLDASSLTSAIFEARQKYKDSPTQIFSSYQDKVFHQISSYYIGNQKTKPVTSAQNEWGLVSWVKYSDNTFYIEDPHKGCMKLQNFIDADSIKIKLQESEILCAQSVFKQLLLGAYLFKR